MSMTKKYKIEKKPMFWSVSRYYGAYSDREEYRYVIAANSPEEAQLLFKAYWREAFNEWHPCLVFENGEKFNPTDRPDEDIDWEEGYGDAADVRISMLKIIHIQSL